MAVSRASAGSGWTNASASKSSSTSPTWASAPRPKSSTAPPSRWCSPIRTRKRSSTARATSRTSRCGATAQTGGVIGITNWAPLNFRAGAQTRPTIAHFLEAIDHAVQLVGIDHVGVVGTDISHGTYPDGDLVREKASSWGPGYAGLGREQPRSRLRHVRVRRLWSDRRSRGNFGEARVFCRARQEDPWRELPAGFSAGLVRARG